MDYDQVGFIAHGVRCLWLAGPLPSPGSARLLVRFYDGIDIDQIPEDVRQRLIQKWQLLPDFISLAQQHAHQAKHLKWAISLESHVAESLHVRNAIEFINRQNIPVFSDTGPYVPEQKAHAWSGEDC